MHVIARKRLLVFAKEHSDAYQPLDAWYRLVKTATWKNFSELRRDIGSADVVGNLTVFNIKGNRYRLIADVQYEKQIVFIKYVLTHQEYDKDEWKRNPYY